jgi:putative membrane protein
MGFVGWLLMALFWVALIGLVVWALMRLVPAADGGPEARRSRSEEPREILERRLASGEIDVATYEQLSSKLDASSPVGKEG